jgi:hypothetical protein
VVTQWADIDKPGVQVAVQAGTFMEPVMAAALKQARMVVVKPPATRERELESGRVDVFMTDYPYSRRLLDNADWATLVAPPKPFHVLPYAYAVKPGDDDWLAQVDGFVHACSATAASRRPPSATAWRDRRPLRWRLIQQGGCRDVDETAAGPALGQRRGPGRAVGLA